MVNKTNLERWPAIAVILLWVAPAIASGATIYVDANGPPMINAAVAESCTGRIGE